MVQLICHTNLDINKGAEKWPSELPVCPAVGDLIESGHKWRTPQGERVLQLQVVRVTWKLTNVLLLGTAMWAAWVELHLPPNRFSSILEFNQWYNSLGG